MLLSKRWTRILGVRMYLVGWLEKAMFSVCHGLGPQDLLEVEVNVFGVLSRVGWQGFSTKGREAMGDVAAAGSGSQL